jgi:hypothetical protein
MARVLHLLPEAHLAVFSKLKYVNSYNFQQFREYFRAQFKKGFVCKANTFDNVHGEFPISFAIWELNGQKFPSEIKLDIYNGNGTTGGTKSFYNGEKYINDWFRHIGIDAKDEIAVLHSKGIDFQNNRGVWLCINQTRGGGSHFVVTKQNIIESCIYFSVRFCMEPTWLNDRDQFLYPNDDWKDDAEFQHDCLIFTLFHGQNRISCVDGVNHWIPFTEQQVNSRDKFESNFMSGFIKNLAFSDEAVASKEAKAVLSTGLELWKYYHKKTKGNNTVSVNASFYDIRAFFQGRADDGKMNHQSTNETYNSLIKLLRKNLKLLSLKIEPKVYEYGFLKE